MLINGNEYNIEPFADLSYANLRYADLRYANLRYADLRKADLSGANLRKADLPDFQIPQDGDLTVWKKLRDRVLAKLLVPEGAKRTTSLVGRKCRAEFVRVLELSKGTEGVSQHDEQFIYKVGEIVSPDSYDDDIRVECSHGIHFFLTKEEAETW